MNPVRAFYIKLTLAAAALAWLRWKTGLAAPLAKPLHWIAAVCLALSIFYPIGKPLYALSREFQRITTPGMRFFFSIALVASGFGAYRYWMLQDISFFSWVIAALALLTGLFRTYADTLFGFWMKGAHSIQFVVLRLLLSLAYAIAVVPVGLIARATGKRFLQTRPDPNARSYWEDRPANLNPDVRKYEHHF